MVKNDKERLCCYWKIFDELPAFSTWITGVNSGDFAPTCWICFADNSSQIFWEERQNCNLALQPWRITTENFRNATLRLKTNGMTWKNRTPTCVNLLTFGLKSVFGGLKRMKKTLYQLEKRRNPFRVNEKRLKEKNLTLILLISTNFSHFVSYEKTEKTTFKRENSVWISNFYRFDDFATRKKAQTFSWLFETDKTSWKT